MNTYRILKKVRVEQRSFRTMIPQPRFIIITVRVCCTYYTY